jgi:hypothetical protein
VVPPQNVDRLADALRRLAADEPFRRTLAASAVETARAFDLADTVTRTEHLLLNAPVDVARLGRADASVQRTLPLPAEPRS